MVAYLRQRSDQIDLCHLSHTMSDADVHTLSKGIEYDKDVQLLQASLAHVAQEQHAAAAQEAQRVPLPGNERFVARLTEGIGQGDIPPRSPLYQTFMACVKNSADYKECNTNEKKRAFRLQWAKSEFESATVEVSRTKAEEWQDVDEEIGTYESFDRIVWLEGGHHSPAAVAAAKLYCEKALKMKGKWVSWNPMTERVDVLYVKVTHRSVFTKLWGVYCRETSNPTSAAAVGTSPATVTTTPVKTVARATVKAEGKVKGGAAKAGGDATNKTVATTTGSGKKRPGGKNGVADGEGDQPDGDESAAKKIRADVLRKAGLTKSAYIRVSSVHGQILHSIATDVSYSWAKNDLTVNKLKEKMAAVQQRVDQHNFFKFYILNDVQVVRQLYTADDLQRLLPMFVTELEKLIQHVNDEHVRFNKMHVASLQ